MKFKDKLELFKALKKEIVINNLATRPMNATPVQLIQKSYSQPSAFESINKEEFKPMTDEQVTALEERRKKAEAEVLERARKRERFKKQQAAYKAAVAEQKTNKDNYPPGPPGMYEFNMPPSPAETKILIDGELEENIYSVEYVYIYRVDDRTKEDIEAGVPEDEFHVLGCLTIQFFSPGDAETFSGETISLVNFNDLGQMFEIHFIGVHPLAEFGGVALNDTVMAKTVWFEAKDIIGRCRA